MNEPRKIRALILVDIQNDFLPGGALAVANGDKVIPIANLLSSNKEKFFDVIVATQDWHPLSHGSFASNNPGAHVGELSTLDGLPQIMWPNHCVQDTFGAKFATQLRMENVDDIFHKGTDPAIDSYSGFFDNAHRKSTGLGEFLKAQGIERVVILGLATDHCVKFTALDAQGMRFHTTVIEDGTRAVNFSPQDGAQALEELRKAGVVVMLSQSFLERPL